MTNQHPITPPPELVSEWTRNRGYSCSSELWDYLATQAAQWGADQELEACCEWLVAGLRTPYVAIRLRSDRRSKPPDVLALHYQEKIKLAQNPNTPTETLKVLATDEDYAVRCGVARNPNTPVETPKVLATDEDYTVRYCVAENPNYKTKTIELTPVQYDALKVLLESSRDESLKTLAL